MLPSSLVAPIATVDTDRAHPFAKKRERMGHPPCRYLQLSFEFTLSFSAASRPQPGSEMFEASLQGGDHGLGAIGDFQPH